MHRRRMLAALGVAVLTAGLLVPDATAARRKPKQGVFGTINGKKFNATNRSGVGDPCVNGIYRSSDGGVVFGAIECRPHRRRQGNVKRNYKVVVVACANLDQSMTTLVPPYQLTCIAAGYTETKTGRFGRPISMTEWGVSTSVVGTTLQSSVNMRVDGIDGNVVRGAISGTFDTPISGAGSAVPAPIQGEIQFQFPFQVQ